MDLAEMQLFYTIAFLLSNKRVENKTFLSFNEYNKRLEEIKNFKIMSSTPGKKKKFKVYKNVILIKLHSEFRKFAPITRID